MKTSQQSTNGDASADPHADKNPRSWQEAAAPLPHETDQDPGSQHEDHPRPVGKQAHQDLERGLQDTDRRGGGDYQERTQNDAQSDVNAERKRSAAQSGKG